MVDVDPEEVKPGDIFTVNPGEKIELDGIVESGGAEVDTAALTGESIPASVSAGDEVYSGSVNADGLLRIKATKAYSDSTVARILDMIQDADSKKSHAEKIHHQICKILHTGGLPCGASYNPCAADFLRR